MVLPRYKIDLKAYMALSEQNYIKVMKLLPVEQDQQYYRVQLPSAQTADVCFSIKQRCKYTTMLTITQSQPIAWMDCLDFDVRIYHDAKMLEIMRFQQQKVRHGRYDYPNEKMFQKDEKLRQQAFLAQCLSYCLAHGLVDVKAYTA